MIGFDDLSIEISLILAILIFVRMNFHAQLTVF